MLILISPVPGIWEAHYTRGGRKVEEEAVLAIYPYTRSGTRYPMKVP
jgi:hypothetical protein